MFHSGEEDNPGGGDQNHRDTDNGQQDLSLQHGEYGSLKFSSLLDILSIGRTCKASILAL